MKAGKSSKSIEWLHHFGIASTHGSTPVLEDLPISPDIYRMLPYLATLIVLAFASKYSQAPAAAGEPYDVGKR